MKITRVGYGETKTIPGKFDNKRVYAEAELLGEESPELAVEQLREFVRKEIGIDTPCPNCEAIMQELRRVIDGQRIPF